MKIEHKKFEFEVRELKEAGADGVPANRALFSGYASAYGNQDLGGDIVAQGAFSKSIAKNKTVIVLADHTATVKNQIGFGFDLVEDSKGLSATTELNLDKEAGREVYAMLKHAKERGYKVGLSIGYSVNDYEWDEKNRIRTIKSADLWEYSVVIFPMNPKATVTSMKSILESGKADEIAEAKRRIESHLRDEEGFSRSEAEAFVSKGFCAFRDESNDEAVKSINEVMERIRKCQSE